MTADSQMPGQQKIIQVAVPLPVRGEGLLCYDYLAGPAANSPIGTIVHVPLGSRLVWGLVMGHGSSDDVPSPRLKEVAALADSPPLTEAHLRFLKAVASWTMAPFGMVMRMMLSTPSAFQPPATETIYHVGQRADETQLTPKRQRIWSFLEANPPLPAKELAQETGTSLAIVKAMAKVGLLESYEVPKQAIIAQPNPDHKPVTLTAAQQEVVAGIKGHLLSGYSAHLLDGVTGSGKTEVYFELVADQIRAGKQLMILLPEIALTAAWQSRFEARFGVKPVIWHSSISPAKRRHIWRACLAGEPMVVVGARSALFLPFTSLGLIIIDEEHEAAFKQEDMVFYHARDMAVQRAYIETVPVILATATPSLESWVNAGQGSDASQPQRYHHWQLSDRHGGARLPQIEMIDLKRDKPAAGKWLSAHLVEALQETLAAGKQSLLYLNRRGYAPLSICESCGAKATCQACDSWLVTHRLSGARQCHHCGFRTPLRPPADDQCDDCGTKGQMRAYGPGVERLAEEVGHLFPEARYCVFSSDTMARPEIAAEMLRAITEGEVDIIIGTQMAAKGHHFPNLTLVGVIDADLGLAGGDLRAAERTYQILSQAAGRAGRTSTDGRAMLQSYEPDNAVFKALASGDRDRFLALETELREQAEMPPFTRLAALILQGPDEHQLLQVAKAMAEAKPQFQQVDIWGPTPAPIARIRGRHRIRFLIRSPKKVNLQQILHGWVADVKIPSQIHLQIDIDPYSFL